METQITRKRVKDRQKQKDSKKFGNKARKKEKGEKNK